MKINRLGELLESFKDEDWKAYQKFAKSRYSEQSDQKAIIDHIKKHKERLDPKKLDSETLRKKIRPEAKPIVFANVVSKLCKHIEAYFIWAEVMNDQMMEDTLLLQAFAKRGLTDQFHKQKKKAKVNRDKQPLGLWNQYHEFMGEYLDYYKRMTITAHEGKTVLEQCSFALAKFCDELNNYLGVEMHNRTRITGEKWDSPFQYLSKNFKPSEGTLLTLFHYFKVLKEERSWDTFYLLENELINANLSKELEFTIITYLGSFLKWKNLNNDEKASQELLNLYTYGLENEILFPNKVIPLNSFATIIMIGANTGNHNWAENFILKYSEFVSDKNTDQIKSYGFAHLSFEKGDFLNTVKILRSKKFNDYILELKAKWLLVSALYELNPNDFENFEYYITSIISFIKRNKGKSSNDGDKAFLTSVKYLKKLIFKKDLIKLEQDIRKEKKIVQKRWFLKKIKGLRKSTRSPI